jgi:hypothetical protein
MRAGNGQGRALRVPEIGSGASWGLWRDREGQGDGAGGVRLIGRILELDEPGRAALPALPFPICGAGQHLRRRQLFPATRQLFPAS